MFREKSAQYVLGLGLTPNPNLPPLGEMAIHKPIDAVGRRLLAMNVCVALAHGFPLDKGIEWLHREGVWLSLTEEEQGEIRSKSIPQEFEWYVESLWSLAWTVSLVGPLSPAKGIPETFVYTFPDLKTMEPSAAWLAKLQFRVHSELIQALDIYYCLHNAIRSEILGHTTRHDKMILAKTVQYQRHSLEWIFEDCDWDDVSLDT